MNEWATQSCSCSCKYPLLLPTSPSFSLSHIPVRGLPYAPRNVGFIKLFNEGASSPLFNAPASPETLSLHILPLRWIVMESCGEAAMEE